MPYQSISQLPDSVRECLPAFAQEIYAAVFNNIWEAFDHDQKRAHRTAWAAVKRGYERDPVTGMWRCRR